MSLMDQAFIKAYAKDSPVVTSTSPDDSTATSARSAGTSSPAHGTASYATAERVAHAPRNVAGPSTPIEELYSDGTLYRLESSATDDRGSAVPAPHYGIKTPRASRRTGRRQTGSGPALELPPPPPPAPTSRPGRRGITRNLSEILRQLEPVAPAPQSPVEPIESAPPVAEFHFEPLAEQAPEITFHEPPKPVRELAPAPVPPVVEPPPTSQPLPELTPATWNESPTIEPAPVEQAPVDWSLLAASSQVVLPELRDFEIAATDSLLAFELAPLVESVPTPADLPSADERAEPQVEPVVDELLQRTNESVAEKKFRVDAAHVAVPEPHLPATELAEETSPELTIVADHPHEIELLPLEAEPEPEPREYALADATEIVAKLPTEQPIEGPKKPCVPLWEVDEFIWPATCEKLLTDERSYFMQAGSKLLAACKDGLKTLAITGSRRGEGRTTLALCLARCAAKAGLQVAVIDADFARPQLASQVGLEVAYGWQEAALGKIPLAEAAVKSVADKITLLPLEAASAGAALSLSDPRVTATLRAAAATFELVIVDLGPLAGGHEPLFPLDEVCPLDACIVVRDLRYASAAESQSVGERLYVAGVEAVGIAENFVQHD